MSHFGIGSSQIEDSGAIPGDARNQGLSGSGVSSIPLKKKKAGLAGQGVGQGWGVTRPHPDTARSHAPNALTPDKGPGSLAGWIRQLGNAERSVPCGRCARCCIDPLMHAVVQPDEAAGFPEAVPSPLGSGKELPRRADGSCVHLIDGRCAIYERRPHACRAYDCRPHLLGIPPIALGNLPHVQAVVAMWAPWSLETEDDVDAVLAWTRALKELIAETVGAGGRLRTREMLGLITARYRQLLPVVHEVRDALGLDGARRLAEAQLVTLRRYSTLKVVPRAA